MSYKVSFLAISNFPMYADSFSVVSIQYIDQGLRGCNKFADSFLYKCWNMKMKSICY